MFAAYFEEAATGCKLVEKEIGRDIGPHGISMVRYFDKSGIVLQCVFDHFETNLATFRYGRVWNGSDGWSTISNLLSVFAERVGEQFPDSMKIGYGDEIGPNLQLMSEKIGSVLPKIQEQSSADFFAEAERVGEFGAAVLSLSRYGPNYDNEIGVT